MQQDWDIFWSTLEKKGHPYSKVLSFYRTQIIARAVNHYINKYFDPKGIFVECGAGKSETTAKTRKESRTLVALDYSAYVLRKTTSNPMIDSCINADTLALPLRAGSVDGIWNVGVMEHFNADDIDVILREFRRVLRCGGKVILLWPLVYAPWEIFVYVVEFFVNIFSRTRFQFYPDEVSRLKSKNAGRRIIEKNKFRDVRVYFNFRDAFSFAVVVATK